MDIEAFILVGGKSSRMGRDKATLLLGGMTLIERAAATIQDAISPPRTTLVAAGTDQLISIFGHRETLPFVFDVYQNRGPFGAVHAALAHARTKWVLILACDLPFVTSEMLLRLSEHVSEDTDAVAPIQADGKIQPLCAFYRVEPCLRATEETMKRNRPTPSVRSILEQVRATLVSPGELANLPGSQNFFLNLNTPEDFRVASEVFTTEAHRTRRS